MSSDILDILKEKIKTAKENKLTDLDEKFLQEINEVIKENNLKEEKVSLACDWGKIYLNGAILKVAEKLGLIVNMIISDDSGLCICYSEKLK